jgi:hypothetical protein
MQWASRLAIAAAIVIAGACGGSKSANNGAPSPDGGGVDATDTEAGATGDDSGSDADADVYPAAHAPLPLFTNFGGGVLANPKIVTVTFLGNTSRDAIRTFDDQLIAGTWWTSVTQGYGVGAATGGIYVEVPDTVSNTMIDDSQLPGMISQWIASGAAPAPDANTLYIIYFPSTTTITLEGSVSCNAFGAYHNSGQVGLEASTSDTPYAVIPDCGDGMPGLTTSASHETIEASTNPHPETHPAWYGYNDAWFKDGGGSGGQGEVADVCQRAGYVTDSYGNLLVRSWVDQAAMAGLDPCQPEAAGEIFFSDAVPTQVAASTTTGGTTSGGYIVMKQGETKTIDTVVFSDAPLPSDLALSVGARGYGTVGALGTGITTTLSSTTGHNGEHVTLTITVAADTPAEDYPTNENSTGIVRATLTGTSADGGTTSSHHDWPFILRVQEM